MAAQIPILIPAQSFELVRDRIGLILTEEFANQSALDNNNPNIKPGMWIERTVPFDKTHLPAGNVMLAKGQLDGHTQIQTDGTYTYNIDFHVRAKSSGGDDGDKLAMLRLQRLIGMARAILENPRYKTLGFPAPFVMWRRGSEILISEPTDEDGENVAKGRLTFMVKVPENTELIVPSILKGYDTTVKLYLTDQGYVWSSEEIPEAQQFDYTLDFKLA